ncbi:flippase-like domain-containing protein [Candidatus Woesearchaeota archaeon]|nr:flippase-like domain-containing protein [Candidatus Woesearchaeota archaeon]
MNKKVLFFIVSISIGLALLAIVYSRIPVKEVLDVFDHASIPLVVRYIFIVSCIELLLVLRWKLILKAQNIFVPFHKLLMYHEIGYATGYLSPQAHIGGEPVKALCLKKHSISFKKGISSILIDKSMSVTTDAFFAFIGFILLFINFSLSSQQKLIFLLVVLIPGLLILSFYYRIITQKPTLSKLFKFFRFNKINWLKKFEKEVVTVEKHVFDFFKYSKTTFLKAIIINIILWILMFMEYRTVLSMFGYSASLTEIFLVLALVAVSYSMPVPMALGVLEAGQVSVLGALGLNRAIGLAISILIRTKDLIRTGLGLFFLCFVGIPWKRLFKK